MDITVQSTTKMVEQTTAHGTHSPIARHVISVEAKHSNETVTLHTTLHMRQPMPQLANGAARPV